MNFKSKFVITSFMLYVINISAFCQIDKYSSYKELVSIAGKYFQSNNLDSAIVVLKYARSKFQEHDKDATYKLDYLFLITNQDSLSLDNWGYGLGKGYFFGLSLDYNKDRFIDNTEFNRLAKIDKQIGDSLSNIAHVEYEVVLPANYSPHKEYPLLFVFHGNNSNLKDSKSNWTSDLVKDKFIAVFLQSYIYMSNNHYQWRLNDEKTNEEFKEIYELIIDKYSVDKDKVFFLGMSAGGRLAIDYVFNNFLPTKGLVLNCPVIPDLSDSSINAFVDKNKKIAIITGEYDWALNKQKDLINKINSIGGNSNIIINSGLGHQFAKDFPTLLDGYLKWLL
ncbi:hypothetical protein ACFLT1_01125 [Bacteroidota bacterium]